MTTVEWVWIPFWSVVGVSAGVFAALFLLWLGALWVLSHGGLRRRCCSRWDPLYGCPEETCPGCFLDKPHDAATCTYGCFVKRPCPKCGGDEIVRSTTTDPDGVGEIYCTACGHVLQLWTEQRPPT